MILTPLESDSLHCLSLADGSPLWTEKRGDNLYVAGLREKQVLLVGAHAMTSLNLPDGKPAWTTPAVFPDAAVPSGRGVDTGEHYFLPLSNATVVQIDLKQGSIVQQARSPREIVPGNLLWHQGVFISQGTQFLQAFDELETLDRQVRQTLQENPRDEQALSRLGAIELNAGRIDEGISHFRQAYEIAKGAQTRNLLIAALLDGMRANLPNRQELSEELDRLIGP